MDKKIAKESVQKQPSRVWTTNGKPSAPPPKVWNGSGRVVRDKKP